MQSHRLISVFAASTLFVQAALPALLSPLPSATVASAFAPPIPKSWMLESPTLNKSNAPTAVSNGSYTFPILEVIHHLSETPAVAYGGSHNRPDTVGVELHTGGIFAEPSLSFEIPNPYGPSLSFSPYFIEGSQPIDNGFGPRFTHQYNYGWDVRNTEASGNVPAYPKYFDLVFPNGTKANFENNSGSYAPTVGVEVPLSKADGWSHSFKEAWWGVEPGNFDYIRLTYKDGSEMRFSYTYNREEGFNNLHGEKVFRPTKISDKVGNFITLEYDAENMPFTVYDQATQDWKDVNISVRNLKAIKNSSGSTILALGTNGQGSYTNAVDNFGRKVLFTVARTNSFHPVPDVYLSSYELTSVSQIGSVNDATIPTLQTYTYTSLPTPGPTGLTYRALWKVGHLTSTGGMSETRITYDSSGRAQYIDDSYNNRTEFVYSLTQATIINLSAPVNNVRTEERRYSYLFDTFVNITGVLDTSGQPIANFTYTSAVAPQKVTTSTDAYGRTWTNTYDSDGNLKWSDTPRKMRTLINDGAGGDRVTKISVLDGSNPSLPMSQWPLLKTPTEFEYTSLGTEPPNVVKKIKGPIPGEINTGNQQITTINYQPVTTSTTDVEGLVTSVVTPGNNAEPTHTVTINYGPSPKLGQPISITNGAVTGGLPEIISFQYDARGNRTITIDPKGAIAEAEYNLADQVTRTYSLSDSAGLSQRTKYDTYFSYPGGPAVANAVLKHDNTVLRSTITSFDYEWNPVAQSGSGEDWQVTYNSYYSQKTFKDGNLSSTRTTYDNNGRPTLIQYPGTTGSSGADTLRFTGYNLNGEVTQTIDGRGTYRNFSYDPVDGALASVTGGASFTLTRHPVRGDVTSVLDDSGTRSVTIDDLGNTISSTTTYTAVPAETFTYEYYPDGSRKKMMNSAGMWLYSYDKTGRYTSMTSPLGTTYSEYFADGLQKKRTTPLGGITEYTYLPSKLLATHINKRGTTTYSNFAMTTYDDALNVKTWTQSVVPPGAGPQGNYFTGYTTYTRQADSGTVLKDRLTREQGSRFGGYDESNSYDGADNATTFRNITRTFNTNNQLTSVAGGGSFAYDGNGNPTTYMGKTATYDAGNRLTSYPNTANTTWQAGYRADNLRSWVQSSSTSTPSERVYAYYDGGNAVLEKKVTGHILSINVFAPDGLVARNYNPPAVEPGPEEEEVEMMVGASYRGDYLFDWQGNATHIICPSGVIINGQPQETLVHSAYNAWGQKNYLYPANFNSELHRFGYNARWGYRTDTETGLVYCQNRYYDPANGRWLTRDPIGTAGGVNLYSYCGAGPVGTTDPSGLFKLIIIGNNDGVPLGDWGGRQYLPKPEGDDRTNWGRDMSKKEILEAMIYCDEFYFYGHGSTYGDLKLDGGEWITSEDIKYVLTVRAMLGRGKMKNVYLGSCWSCRTKDSVNLWLLLTMELTGYPEVTAAKWPPQINSPQTFRSPVRRNPGNEWSPAIGDPKLEATFAEKKGRKRIGKRKG